MDRVIEMKTSTVVEAKAHFSALLSSVAAGEEIVVTRRGQPVARIVPPGNAGPFDLRALRAYVEAAPGKSGMTVEEMRAADRL
jgi:prevent-host-death family protein